MIYKYPLANSSWDEQEINAMMQVIQSGNFTMGEEVQKFENIFANYFGSKYCVMVNSGSSANLLMIAALFYTHNKDIKLKKGDEVIVPAVSWSTTYYPLYQYGLKLKFVDIDIETLNYDINELKNAITDKTRLIFVVNLLGNPNDFELINNLTKNKNITFIEDNCESMGSLYGNKFTGTFGIMGSFSTYFSHHISTMEGGMIVTDNEELFHILLSLRSHGWTRNLPDFNLVTGHKSNYKFDELFRFVLPGYNLRPLELEGAVGISQLNKLKDIVSVRRKNALVFKEIMKNNANYYIQKEIGISSWFGFSIVIREESNITRDFLINKLNDIGFECRPIVGGNFTKNEVMNYFDYSVHGELKNADYIDKRGLFIGNHHYDISNAIEELINI